jgi:hypothetical protein
VLDDFLEYRRVQFISDVLPVALGQYEVGVAKDAEVARDSSPGGREPVGDLARGARSGSEELEDLASGGVGEGSESGVHGRESDN